MFTIGAFAVIFDDAGRVLLCHRRDIDMWNLPGGGMESGELPTEAVIREVTEETGLDVIVGRLIGVYGDPDWVVDYGDGKHHQIVALCLEAEREGGEPGPSGETLASGFFSIGEIAGMDVMEHHRERIADALAGAPGAFIR